MADTRTSRSQALLQMAAFALGGTLGLCAGASADESSGARAGAALAAQACSPCHVVAKPVGPPFADIANGPRAAPDALRDFLHATHSDIGHAGAMPNPQLTDRQIEEIAAYLATLHAK